MYNKYYLLIFVVLLQLVESIAVSAQPNILWISCEDISPHLGCYGSQDAITPTLDALASEGVRYTHAFTSTPVCATNRSSIITGMYPTTIGTQHMRCEATLAPGMRCFTEYLRENGYYCTNNSKEDYNFITPSQAWDDSSGSAHWRGRKPEQPFFAVFNFVLSHESKVWPRGKAHRKLSKDLTEADLQNPTKITPPPYYPDTPEVRRDWANYLENITQIDHQASQVLQELSDDNLEDETIVFFWSDHGAGLPRAKRWPYDSGTCVPLIIRIPAKLRVEGQAIPNSVNEELISFIDLAPTILNLAGIAIPPVMQGRAFLGPNLSTSREFVVTSRDRMDGRYDLIRSVRDRRFRYVRNYMPWKAYAQYISYAEVNQTMKALRRAQEQGTLPIAAQLFMSDTKPVEELYDVQADPDEIVNLASSQDAEHQRILDLMRKRLNVWETESRDLGLIPEPQLRAYESMYGPSLVILQHPNMRDSLDSVRQLLDPTLTPAERIKLARGRLNDQEAVTRYWAVLAGTHAKELTATSADGSSGEGKLEASELEPLLADSDPTVRITAASAICAQTQNDAALDALLAGLKDDSSWVRLVAANYLDEVAPDDPRAVAALESVKEVAGDDYVSWVSEHALHRIDGREMPDRWKVPGQ